MSSSQTITPTILVLGASKSATPPAEPKVNNTFNQVFKNEVASKTKKTPVETVKNPVPNKSNITPSNSITPASKNSARPAPPTEAPINNATNTAPSNSNNKEEQSGSVNQIEEDDIRPEEQKLPDLNDPVSLYNFVNKINELAQASSSNVPLGSEDIAKTTEILSNAVSGNLDDAKLLASAPDLTTSALPPPYQGSDVNAATSTAQGKIEDSLLQSRVSSELSTEKDSKLTTLPVESQGQTTSLQTVSTSASTSAAAVDHVSGNELKKEATLAPLPTKPESTDAVDIPREIPRKPAPPMVESNRLNVANGNAKTTANSMPPKGDGIKIDRIDRIPAILTPPPSSDVETALSHIDATSSTTLASQHSANNSNDARSILDKTNSRLTPPPSASAETALGEIDATQSSPLTNQLKTSNVDGTKASVSKVDPLLVPPPSSSAEAALGKIDTIQSMTLGNQIKTNEANDARASVNKIDPVIAPPPSASTEKAVGNVDATQSAVLASQLKANNVNDTHVTFNEIDPQLAPPPRSNTEAVSSSFVTTESTALASQAKTNNLNGFRMTSQADKSPPPPAVNELNKSISASLATGSKVDLNNTTTGQNKSLSKNVEAPTTTNTQKSTLQATQAPTVSIQTLGSSDLANDLSTVSLVNAATPETSEDKSRKNIESALTTNAQAQALPAAPGLMIPVQKPSDSALANDRLPLPSVKTVAAETDVSKVNRGIEKPEQSNSVLGSSELFSSALSTEFARAQQEQTVAQESHAIEEFAVKQMTAEVATPAPTVQAPPAALSSLPVTEYIAARFGTKAWDQAIGQKIVWMVAGGEQTAQLTLNPPDLGPVQVVLSISDSFVDASFVSSHLDVREAIEAAAPKLREMMDNAGISLSGFSVSAESAHSGNPFNSEKSQHNSQSQTRNVAKADDIIDSTKLNTSAQRPQPGLGLVDTFA